MKKKPSCAQRRHARCAFRVVTCHSQTPFSFHNTNSLNSLHHSRKKKTANPLPFAYYHQLVGHLGGTTIHVTPEIDPVSRLRPQASSENLLEIQAESRTTGSPSLDCFEQQQTRGKATASDRVGYNIIPQGTHPQRFEAAHDRLLSRAHFSLFIKP